ncbi:MAG: hypothetical protein [Circular genetic element sp.]|nr:MAG: hypothetical protein [Circular genetic element sp.]
MANRYFETLISSICGGQYCATVHHWHLSESAGPANDFTLAKQFNEMITDDGFLDNYRALLAADDCFVSSIRTREINNVTGGNTAVKVFAGDDKQGTFTGSVDPFQVAGCVIWITEGLTARTGRTFFPGVAEEAMDEGRFNTTYQDAVQTLINDVVAGGSVPAGPVLMTLVTRGPLFAANDIIDGYLSPKVGTQRRRLTPV